MRSFSLSAHSLLPAFLLLLFATTLTPTIAQSNPNPVLTSSFTWNPTCGPTVACGPAAAGYHGTGFAASNNLTYAGCTKLGASTVDCSAASIVSGVGKGCGQCWHITPQSDWYPSNGRSVGTSVVVKINDQCTDAGYCDQTEAHPLNTGYGKEVHIDLCAESGVTGQFFGAVGPGVVVGLAQLLPDCSALDDGPYGSGLGSLDGSSSASSSSSSSSSGSASSSSGGGSSSSSGSDSSSTSESSSSSSSASDSSSSSSGSESSSSSGSDSSSSSGSGSSSSSGSGSSSSSGSDSSSSSGSDSSSSSGSDSSAPSGSDTSASSASSSSSSATSEPSPLDIVSSGSGNWSFSSTKMAKHKLTSSGHDGQKAGANVVVGGAGSNAASNDDDNRVSSSTSSSSVVPPTPTTLVAVISSSTASPAPVSSSLMVGVEGSGQGGDDEDEDEDDGECDGGDGGEL